MYCPTALAILLTTAALAYPCLGAENPEPARATTEAMATPPGSAGVKVFVDPATGELIAEPTAEQAAELDQRVEQEMAAAKALEIPEEELEPFQLSNGGVGVFVGGRFMSSLNIHRHADGSWATICSDGEHLPPGIADGVAEPTPSSTELEER
jgi:hypothetical protein